MLQSHGNAEDRVTVSKVRSAIERIDVPPVRASGIAQTLLLAQNVVIRPQAANAFANQTLRFAIGSGNQISFALVLDLDVLVEIFEQQRAGFARDGFHGGEKLMGGSGVRNFGGSV